MEIIAHTKDGVLHKVINGKWEPPIVVPANVHERALRNINGIRREREGKYAKENSRESASVK